MSIHLKGQYRGTNESVSYYDKPVRIETIKALKQTHGYNLKNNPNKLGIDLIHIDRRGGNENEAGKWSGHYYEQPCINFNKFTLPFPTVNMPQQRKEKYGHPSFPCFDKSNKPYIHYEPDYQFNSYTRFNVDFSHFFHIDNLSEVIRNENILVRGLWETHTVTAGLPEHWLCFRVGVADYFIKNNNIFVQDYSYDVGTEKYEELHERYTREYEIYHETQKLKRLNDYITVARNKELKK
jgi:hypothetical protein